MVFKRVTKEGKKGCPWGAHRVKRGGMGQIGCRKKLKVDNKGLKRGAMGHTLRKKGVK